MFRSAVWLCWTVQVLSSNRDCLLAMREWRLWIFSAIKSAEVMKPSREFFLVLVFVFASSWGSSTVDRERERYCLLITLTCSPKAELRRAQLNGIGWMHVKGASGSHQTAMNDLGAQQPSQMFLTWVKARPQRRELRALLFTNSVWVL